MTGVKLKQDQNWAFDIDLIIKSIVKIESQLHMPPLVLFNTPPTPLEYTHTCLYLVIHHIQGGHSE